MNNIIFIEENKLFEWLKGQMENADKYQKAAEEKKDSHLAYGYVMRSQALNDVKNFIKINRLKN